MRQAYYNCDCVLGFQPRAAITRSASSMISIRLMPTSLFLTLAANNFAFVNFKAIRALWNDLAHRNHGAFVLRAWAVEAVTG